MYRQSPTSLYWLQAAQASEIWLPQLSNCVKRFPIHCMCAIEIYGQAVNCIPEEIAEVFAITANFAPYILFSTTCALVRYFCTKKTSFEVTILKSKTCFWFYFLTWITVNEMFPVHLKILLVTHKTYFYQSSLSSFLSKILNYYFAASINWSPQMVLTDQFPSTDRPDIWRES